MAAANRPKMIASNKAVKYAGITSRIVFGIRVASSCEMLL
ncbi:hypothetical protein CU005_2380 [Enterococcus faecium]|nr:hypothetical protein [Enterococcus faecium]